MAFFLFLSNCAKNNRMLLRSCGRATICHRLHAENVYIYIKIIRIFAAANFEKWIISWTHTRGKWRMLYNSATLFSAKEFSNAKNVCASIITKIWPYVKFMKWRYIYKNK